MVRHGSLWIVLALALVTLVSAAAYNQAVVTSSASFTVTATDEAKLALVPKATTASGNKDGVARVDAGGKLTFDFGNLQPDSTYTWNDLFKVKNNSLETVDIAITSSGTTSLYFSTDGSTWTQGSASSTGVAPTTGEVSVSVKLQIAPGDTLAPVSGSIVVTSTAK